MSASLSVGVNFVEILSIVHNTAVEFLKKQRSAVDILSWRRWC